MNGQLFAHHAFSYQNYTCKFLLTLAGRVSVGQMHDLLVEAMQTADEIICDKLNGVNFIKVYVSQKAHLLSVSDKIAIFTEMRKKMTEV